MNYKKLLEKEENILKEIEISKESLKLEIDGIFTKKSLFGFVDRQVEKQVRQDYLGDYDLKKHIISMSMDFIYDQITLAFLVADPESDSRARADIKESIQLILDKYYFDYKTDAIHMISDYIDEKFSDKSSEE